MIRFLLDTCVVSDLGKSGVPEHLAEWGGSHDARECGIGVLTLAEIRYGIELLPAGRRRDQLRSWMDESVKVPFKDRTIGVDAKIAETWAVLSARAQSMGRNLEATDGLLLATAAVHRLSLVTRNVRHFSGYGVSVINPYVASEA